MPFSMLSAVIFLLIKLQNILSILNRFSLLAVLAFIVESCECNKIISTPMMPGQIFQVVFLLSVCDFFEKF